MKRIVSMLAAVIACTAAGAQTIDDILGQVGENNLTLKALQQQLEAGADANLAEAKLEGPEVEFGYLFGEDGPVVCEVNSNAHIRNLYECTGRDVSYDILGHIEKMIW